MLVSAPFVRIHKVCALSILREGGKTYQKRMKENHDSMRRQMLKTTQYMSHGVNCAGSDVFKALYEAKIGKRKDAMELFVGVVALPG